MKKKFSFHWFPLAIPTVFFNNRITSWRGKNVVFCYIYYRWKRTICFEKKP